KLKIALGFALCAVAITAHAEKIALVGATAINPADGKVMPNATVVINGDKIEHVSMGKQDAAALGKQIDCAGKFILPGYIETHEMCDTPRVKIDTAEHAREFVRKLTEQKPDVVKISYIVDKDHAVESFRPIVRATIEESHAHNIRVAVHATELETARAAVEEGADVLVHSVIDKPVDEAFVKLLKDRHVILCPTLVVFERYGRVFSHQLNLTPEE